MPEDAAARAAAPDGVRDRTRVAGGEPPEHGGGPLSEPTRVLLIEQIDAIGAAPGDGAARASALRAAGARVELAILEREGSNDLLHAHLERAPRLVHTRHSGARALESLAAIVRESDAERIVWASAQPGGDPAAGQVLGGREARWWRTGLAARGAAHGPLPAATPDPAGWGDAAFEPARSPRMRLPLWDGPFVLALAPSTGEDLERLVAAFAEAAEDRDELELVILGDPHPRVTHVAARHDVLPRVHCVGRAPREAEACWLQTAACLVTSEESARSGGLLLRAMASGHPLLTVCKTDPLHAAMQSHGLIAGPAPASLGERLARALEGGDAVAAATARARAMAERQDADALRERAVGVLRALDAPHRRAA